MGQLQIKDQIVLFDDADADVVGAYQWHLHPTGRSTYARGFQRGARSSGLVYLHRLLTNASKGQDVDHENGDGLDNRRRNLRVCSRTQNNANRHVSSSATGVKGVHFESFTGRWRAEIQHNRKRIKLGRFDTQEAAAMAYQNKAAELFGRFARRVG